MFSEEHIIKDCILLEPPKPIKEYKYLCDRRYHTEFIESLYKNYDTYGIIIIGGEEIKLYSICGTEIKNLNKDKVRISKNQRKGGQSAQRFGRIRDNEIQQYISKCSDMTKEYYLENDIPIVKGIIIAGIADKKDKLFDILHPKLKKIANLITISEKDDIISIIDKCKQIFETNEYELKELDEFFDNFNRDTGMAIYGIEYVLEALNIYKLQKLLVHEQYDNKDELKIMCDNVNCQYIEIPNINNNSDQLLKGYGGIVGISWY